VPFSKRASFLSRPKTDGSLAKSPEPAKPAPGQTADETSGALWRYSARVADTCAKRIDDPVERLKFLQNVAPRLRWKSYNIPWRVAGLILLVGVTASLSAVLFIPSQKPLHPVLPSIKPIERATTAVAPLAASSDVWQVEKTAASEVYSNGLRIDNHYLVANHPRSYLAFPLGQAAQSEGVRRSEPAGIVFHTTESRLAPFEAEQNRVLKKIDESLLEYVRRKHAYHFLIDRFGRVYRVVAETDAANHSGNSVWADDRWLYLNLNQSFFGVSIEARTQPGQVEAEMSPAQLRAVAMLTEMLRSRYHIAAANCVTHAQVSVNPSNMQIGYHRDWASSFPFEQLGLPDNYQRALPALWTSGFEYNPEFQQWAGDRIRAGIQLAEDRLTAQAAESGLSLRAYRRMLQKRYHQELEIVRRANADESEESE
jgi:hypothetical protein